MGLGVREAPTEAYDSEGLETCGTPSPPGLGSPPWLGPWRRMPGAGQGPVLHPKRFRVPCPAPALPLREISSSTSCMKLATSGGSLWISLSLRPSLRRFSSRKKGWGERAAWGQRLQLCWGCPPSPARSAPAGPQPHRQDSNLQP